MLAHGRIVEQGSNLLELSGPTHDLVQKHVSVRNEAAGGAAADDEPAAVDVITEALDDEGKRETVSWGTYGFYLTEVGPFRAALYFALCMTASLVPLAINIYQNYWTSSSVRPILPFFFIGIHS
jgi:hypothetical protein